MILGAGYGQLPAIQKAKEKGYKVIATSYDLNDVGLSAADIPLSIDTADIESIREAAKAYKIDGIMTMATDVAMPSIGSVVNRLGFVGPSPKVALLSTKKILMKITSI